MLSIMLSLTIHLSDPKGTRHLDYLHAVGATSEYSEEACYPDPKKINRSILCPPNEKIEILSISVGFSEQSCDYKYCSQQVVNETDEYFLHVESECLYKNQVRVCVQAHHSIGCACVALCIKQLRLAWCIRLREKPDGRWLVLETLLFIYDMTNGFLISLAAGILSRIAGIISINAVIYYLFLGIGG